MKDNVAPSSITTDSTLSDEGELPVQAALPAQPYIFLVLRADQPTQPPSRHALGEISEVLFRRGATRAAARVSEAGERRLLLTMNDRWMSSEHARMVRDAEGWFVVDGGSKNGTFVNGQRVTQAKLHDGAVIETGRSFWLFRSSLPSADENRDVLSRDLAGAVPALSTLSPVLTRSFALLSDVARSSISVFIAGETGTGKEVVARAIHHLSERGGPFVAVNCGALPATLVEAELFGFRKGSFSGALEDRPGLVRSADGGTLFLDEIGDLPMLAQAALLRVLQEREVVAVGAVKPVKVDIRVVSATHRDLSDLARHGQFRADLLARLTGFRLKLPPLRERREDLGLLLDRLLERADGYSPEGVSFGVDAVRALFAHGWPQNIRELEHRLRLGVVLAHGGVVSEKELFGPEVEPSLIAEALVSPELEPASVHYDDGGRPMSPTERARRDALIALLHEHGGNVSAVARSMGKARMQIQRWIRRYGLERLTARHERE